MTFHINAAETRAHSCARGLAPPFGCVGEELRPRFWGAAGRFLPPPSETEPPQVGGGIGYAGKLLCFPYVLKKNVLGFQNHFVRRANAFRGNITEDPWVQGRRQT